MCRITLALSTSVSGAGLTAGHGLELGREGQLVWVDDGDNGSDEYIESPCHQLLSQGSVSALEAGT